MSTSFDAPYKQAQRDSLRLSICYLDAKPNDRRRTRKASGLSARQWKRLVKKGRIHRHAQTHP